MGSPGASYGKTFKENTAERALCPPEGFDEKGRKSNERLQIGFSCSPGSIANVRKSRTSPHQRAANTQHHPSQDTQICGPGS